MYKDFTRAPTHINTIPVEYLDRVKEWLDSVDISFTDGPLNLNWQAIMKTVTSDPHEFFKSGGWSFLATDSDNESGSENESDEESAFEVGSDELRSASESEEDSEFEDDEDASADEGSEVDEVSDEGEDWDEMEKKAKKDDRKTGHEDEGVRKRKR